MSVTTRAVRRGRFPSFLPPNSEGGPIQRLIWEDEQGEIDFHEEKMVEWFKAAVANLAAFDIPEYEVAWFLFLMGAETAVRGNRGDSITEQAQDS